MTEGVIVMQNYLVFREEALTEKQIGHREEHNERTSKRYNNANIDISLSGKNIYFKKPDKGYAVTFQKKLESGAITTKGLKEDAAHYSEILVAVNREYWIGKSQDEIKQFFETAYKHLAGKFGEENVISAVVHCDEIADGIINYHMHFVGIPTVTKKRYYTKRSNQYKKLLKEFGEEELQANPEILFKSSECQVSHSKFFESMRDDEHRLVYSYSIWQDDLLKVLKEAGYTDIHRGSTNQKAPHLHPMQYKQLMAVIEERADGLLPDIVMEPVNDDYIKVPKVSMEAVFELQREVSKQKATYDLAVESLKKHQESIWERQHQTYKLYQLQKDLNQDYDSLLETAGDYEKQVHVLEEHCEELRKENEGLKAKIQEMFLKILTQNQWLRDLMECLGVVYKETINETAYNLDYFKNSLKEFIESTIQKIKEKNNPQKDIETQIR